MQKRRLRTLEQVSAHQSEPCNNIACNNREAIHYHPGNNQYYCNDCASKDTQAPHVLCGCKGGVLRIDRPYVGVCDTCFQKVEIEAHKDMVARVVSESAHRIYGEVFNLFAQYERQPKQWAVIANLATRLKTEVEKLNG